MKAHQFGNFLLMLDDLRAVEMGGDEEHGDVIYIYLEGRKEPLCMVYGDDEGAARTELAALARAWEQHRTPRGAEDHIQQPQVRTAPEPARDPKLELLKRRVARGSEVLRKFDQDWRDKVDPRWAPLHILKVVTQASPGPEALDRLRPHLPRDAFGLGRADVQHILREIGFSVAPGDAATMTQLWAAEIRGE